MRSWWDRNFNLDNKDDITKRMKFLVTSGKTEKIDKSRYYTRCKEEYEAL